MLKAVHDLGYESPTPIQERSIPVVLEGADMIGQAQTGTGKTAAFALPILSKIDCKKGYIQALILEPTRELAIQSAEACQGFAKYLKDLTKINPAVTKFFDDVLVMDKDEKIKNNRLALLKSLKNKYIILTDFSKL